MTHRENKVKASRKAKRKTVILLTIAVFLTFAFARVSAHPQTLIGAVTLSHVSQSAISLVSSFDADMNDRQASAALALFEDGATVMDLSNIACLPGPPPSCQGQNVFVGKAQIDGWLQQLIAINVQLNQAPPIQVSGNNVSWAVTVSVDEYRRLNVAPLDAYVNATVENQKFSSLSIELTAESTTRLSEAYVASRASPYSVMASGAAFGLILLGLIFPAVGVYYVSRVKRLFATVPHLDKPWVLLGCGVGALFVSVLLSSIRDVNGVSAGIVDPLFGVTLTICAFLVMSSMLLMKRVMLGESDE